MDQEEKKQIRLLLVDNQNDGLKKMATVLRRRYREVILCENLEMLTRMYASERYDIVIVALEMDDNEGYQCVDHIYSRSPSQRIITYSAEPDHPSHGRGCPACLAENRRHRIRKPVVLKELYSEIEEFDQKSCSFAQTAMKLYEGYVSKE